MSHQKTISVSIDVDTLARDISVGNISIGNNEFAAKSWDLLIPRILEWLKSRHIHATFFVVAEDAVSSPDLVLEILSSGHEIASHSLTHPKQLANASSQIIEREIRGSKDLLENRFNVAISGFRAPGYCLSNPMFEALEKAGYLYDASLNLSIPYGVAKMLIKLLSGKKGRDNLAVETPAFRRMPDIYIPCRSKYKTVSYRTEGLHLAEVPIFLLKFSHFPLASSIYNVCGQFLTKHLIAIGTAKSDFIPLELHDFEFASAEDYVSIHG